MHRSTPFTLVLFLFFSLQLCSQYKTVNVNVITPKYIEWNDLTFQLSQNGIKSFIQELKHGDPDMYGQMQFSYNRLMKKQRAAKAIGIVGTAVGMVMVVAGTDSVPLLIAGTTVASASLAYGYTTRIRESDLLNLVNSFNKSTFNKKVKLSIQPLVSNQITGGVMSLQLRF